MHVAKLRGLEPHYRIEADADAVAEVPALGIVAPGDAAHVHRPLASGGYDLDAGGELRGDVGAVGKVVSPAHAEHGERGDGVAAVPGEHEAVDDLVDRAVAPGRDHDSVALARGVAGELGGVPDALCYADIVADAPVFEEGLDFRDSLGGLALAGRGIQDHQVLS